MKYLVLIPDGMADRPIDKLGGRTPMEAAHKPTMDALAAKSVCGTVLNVPHGMVPESDTANLAILSYDPVKYSRGRSPLEAMSLGLRMESDDTALRCNFVTLSPDDGRPYEERTILDHSSGDITTEEADELVRALNDAMPLPGRVLHTGVSYRHCLIWRGASDTYDFTRPHDILGRVIGDYLPRDDDGGAPFLEYMKRGAAILEHHPINEKRRAAGKNPANSPWLWSPGKKPALPQFAEKWGLNATVVAAVDLIKGIAICAGCHTVNVEGATGNYGTNYAGKGRAAIEAFRDGSDLVYVHVEAPDECGHQGNAEEKTSAIGKIDRDILAPALSYLRGCGERFRILVLPDHPTPVALRTHTSDPVPFFIYDSEREESGVSVYSEKECGAKNYFIPDGSTLLSHLIIK